MSTYSTPSAKVYLEPHEVELRLRQIGLTRAPFIIAAQQGDLQRRLNQVADDFSAAAGFAGWARALRTIRQELRKAHGWHRGDFNRIPVSYNQAETMAIAVSSGDERTGVPGDDPVTNAKGPATALALEESTQTGLELEDDEEGVDLWYLLTHATEEGELRAELSLPRFTDERFQISSWHERILFGRIDPDWEHRLVVPPTAPSDIDIAVRRKSA